MDLDALRSDDPEEYVRRALDSIALHVRALLEMQGRGAVAFEYGNNLRAQAVEAGVADAFRIPGFIPEYIRPLFCEGKGPFRWVALSGEPDDIYRTDQAVLDLRPLRLHSETFAERPELLAEELLKGIRVVVTAVVLLHSVAVIGRPLRSYGYVDDRRRNPRCQGFHCVVKRHERAYAVVIKRRGSRAGSRKTPRLVNAAELFWKPLRPSARNRGVVIYKYIGAVIYRGALENRLDQHKGLAILITRRIG